MKITVSTEEAQKSFFPTPPELAAELISGIDWYKTPSILEPSAGTGNLIRAIGRSLNCCKSRFSNMYTPNVSVDMIELDPALRGILTHDLIHMDHAAIWAEYDKLEAEGRHEDAEEAYAMYTLAGNSSIHIVHEDFLQYHTLKRYNLIVMNPPFADGDAHLLKAIAMQERYGGMVRCILNADTLLNPCTNRRKLLVQKLSDLNAEICYKDGAFACAERPTGVRIAIIKIDIPEPHRDSEFFSRFRKAEEIRIEENSPQELTVTDPVQAVISQYRVEVEAGVALIEEYVAMRPYVLEDYDRSKQYNKPILNISINGHCDNYGTTLPDINEYLKSVRLKYWSALFKNKELFGQMTSNLQEELSSRVQEMAECEFDLYNIRLLIAEMNTKMIDGVKETILNLFDQFTSMYHWRNEPEVKNIHYFNGWATNKAHFINKKVILPCYGVFADSWSSDTFKVHSAWEKLADIEKALNYLDGNLTAPVDLYSSLTRANSAGKTKNIQCKFFDVTFFKKGTMHIRFTNQELLDRFNIYCCKEKNWLPPCYGSKKYQDMTTEEQSVIDSFHGDGAPASGESAYLQVLQRSNYYLAPPNQQTVALPGAMY